jgi:hypothetical protein
LELFLDGHTYIWAPLHALILTIFIWHLLRDPLNHGLHSSDHQTTVSKVVPVEQGVLSVQLQTYPPINYPDLRVTPADASEKMEAVELGMDDKH